MSKVAIVYWSGTGNTEAMANFVADGARGTGADVDLIEAGDFSSDKVSEYDGVAFGCPSMGSEVLEEDVFQPMWDDVQGSLSGKKVVLFGSYGWGSGDWMESWRDEAACDILDTYICNEAPDADAEEACKALGAKIA